MKKNRLLYPSILFVMLLSACSNIKAAAAFGLGLEESAKFISLAGVSTLTLTSLGFEYLAHQSQNPILALMGLGALAGVGYFGVMYKRTIDAQAQRERTLFEQHPQIGTFSLRNIKDHTGKPTETKQIYRAGAGMMTLPALGTTYLMLNQSAPAIQVMLGVASLGSLALAGFFGNEYRKMIAEEAKRIREEIDRQAAQHAEIGSIKKAR